MAVLIHPAVEHPSPCPQWGSYRKPGGAGVASLAVWYRKNVLWLRYSVALFNLMGILNPLIIQLKADRGGCNYLLKPFHLIDGKEKPQWGYAQDAQSQQGAEPVPAHSSG